MVTDFFPVIQLAITAITGTITLSNIHPVYILLLQKRAAMDALHNSNASATKFTRRVGIVGAGISGLRCAEVLLSKGYEVIILEARNRIGGRVR